MNDQFQWWLLVLGIGIGAAVTWLIIGALPRREEDVASDERAAEAEWISREIAADGGLAPPPLVEEILQFHRQYLAGPPLEIPAGPPPESTDTGASVPPSPAGEGADRAARPVGATATPRTGTAVTPPSGTPARGAAQITSDTSGRESGADHEAQAGGPPLPRRAPTGNTSTAGPRGAEPSVD